MQRFPRAGSQWKVICRYDQIFFIIYFEYLFVLFLFIYLPSGRYLVEISLRFYSWSLRCVLSHVVLAVAVNTAE